MANNGFLLPDELGWECNDKISKVIDEWRNSFVQNMKAAGKDEAGNWPYGLWEVSKAELMDDIYTVIKEYQKRVKDDLKPVNR